MAHATPLKRLSVMAGQHGLSNLHIPTITDDAEDVVGRIRLQKNDRISVIASQWMDKQRNNLQAYEYLCHIGEAKEWIEDCLQVEIDPIIRLEETMRDGIVLAKLASWFAPGSVHKIVTVSHLATCLMLRGFRRLTTVSRIPSINFCFRKISMLSSTVCVSYACRRFSGSSSPICTIRKIFPKLFTAFMH
ncbi:uncharacterized protein BYT42DRAFT_489566 [Radiomyces spectabilis]|uniref:uncharacterized protein n=1 Tax=Radiomyces spectabilis TaxID=64574 RepID=UPI00221E8BE8|nr:uncharacterized protein BYT42DRAFT_489566 [Radiomyces spectabilis]KAI8391700.1 hypothetical protein BYT42DRAFT_489566 [Radiomyces spectabilis]